MKLTLQDFERFFPGITKQHNRYYGIRTQKKTWKTLLRESDRYKEWRSRILMRDKNICQICRQYFPFLHADHYPTSWADLLKQYNITSLAEGLVCKKLWQAKGRSLCIPCHKETPNFGFLHT